MLKLMLFALLLLVFITAAALLVGVISSALSRRPVMPAAGASNEQWEMYYSRMADSARRSGDSDSASTYEDLAATYRKLQED